MRHRKTAHSGNSPLIGIDVKSGAFSNGAGQKPSRIRRSEHEPHRPRLRPPFSLYFPPLDNRLAEYIERMIPACSRMAGLILFVVVCASILWGISIWLK